MKYNIVWITAVAALVELPLQAQKEEDLEKAAEAKATMSRTMPAWRVVQRLLCLRHFPECRKGRVWPWRRAWEWDRVSR